MSKSMKPPLKVGDRCRAKGYDMRGKWVNLVGILTDLGNDLGQLTIDNGATYALGLRSFSRLVKRERREWWINVYADGDQVAHSSKDEADAHSIGDRIKCIHVREVRKKGGSK